MNQSKHDTIKITLLENEWVMVIWIQRLSRDECVILIWIQMPEAKQGYHTSYYYF